MAQLKTLNAIDKTLLEIVPSGIGKCNETLGIYYAAAHGDLAAQQEILSKKNRAGKTSHANNPLIVYKEDSIGNPYIISEKALLGDLDSIFYVGMMYEKGHAGVKKDPERAAIIFKYAADLGNANACYELAWMHANGAITAANAATAKEWFGKTFECDKPIFRAAYNYGRYLKADGDLLAAIHIFERLIDMKDPDATGWGYLGMAELHHAFNSGYDRQGIDYLMKAAEYGSGAAMKRLAVMRSTSNSIDERESAMRYINRAIDLNIADAMYVLGNWYASGILVEKDISKAVHFHERAAVSGYIPSHKWLINHYLCVGNMELMRKAISRLHIFDEAEAHYFRYKFYQNMGYDDAAREYYQLGRKTGSKTIRINEYLDRMAEELVVASFPDVEPIARQFIEYICREHRISGGEYVDLMNGFLLKKSTSINGRSDDAGIVSDYSGLYLSRKRPGGAYASLIEGYRDIRDKKVDLYFVKKKWANLYGCVIVGRPDNI